MSAYNVNKLQNTSEPFVSTGRDVVAWLCCSYCMTRDRGIDCLPGDTCMCGRAYSDSKCGSGRCHAWCACLQAATAGAKSSVFLMDEVRAAVPMLQ